MGTEQCRSRFNLCLCRALRRCSCTENVSAAEIGEDFGAGALPSCAASKTLSELRHVWHQAEGTNGFMLQRAVIQNFQKDTFHIAMELQPTNEEQRRLKTGELFPCRSIMTFLCVTRKPFMLYSESARGAR